ncbi:sugar transferase [Defluviimonas sp. SAOS-178_SWC]|uniref:sugar transferase n=1 Tax=Defluviimonas sp. SAOS-178_SWC TaxID=3121287 RepID=UPI003221699F
MPVVVPLIALILVVSSAGGGQALYSQPRVGRHGKLFRCWKVRTMIPDADAALARILHDDPALAEEWRTTQKLVCDPRVTRFGALLRRTSLDELPQLWNVLNGTMSLVGPRPFTPDQRGLYRNGRADADYYRLRPGITGLWQVSRRNRGSFSERATYDSVYRTQLGVWTDLAILARTLVVVFRATGV